MHTTTIEETNVHILRKLRLAGDTRRGMVSVCAFEPCPKILPSAPAGGPEISGMFV